MEEWTGMERQPDNLIKTEKSGEKREKRLTSGEMNNRERDRKKKRRNKRDGMKVRYTESSSEGLCIGLLY